MGKDKRKKTGSLQRIGGVIGLAVSATFVLASQSEESSFLRSTQTPSMREEKSYFWSFLRRLAPLSRDEVNENIFERHDEPYPEKTATYSPRPTESPGLGSRPPTLPPTGLPGPPTIAPTSAPTQESETVEQFLTRTLTDDGSLVTAGTPQNQAFVYFTTSFPDITVVDSDASRNFVATTYSLGTLYYSTGGENWLDRTGWVGPTAPCGAQGATPWSGVTCSDSFGFVIDLSLPENDLLGSIPSEIRGLSALQSLDLSGNTLTGSLPTTIGQLGSLVGLYLTENFLTGTIPTTITSVTTLQEIFLDVNQLIGSIPTQLNQLVNLVTLQLGSNFFDGLLPPLTIATLGKSLKSHTASHQYYWESFFSHA